MLEASPSTDHRLWQAAAAMEARLGFDPIEEAGRQWREHWGAATAAPVMAVTSIMRVQQILLARLNDELRPFGLSFARYETLMLLFYSRQGALPLGKIGDRLQVHRASVTNAVDRLVDQGLVERVPHGQDRRAVLAHITPDGRRVARAATKRLNAEGFAIAPLPAEVCIEIVERLRPVRAHAGDFE